MMKFKIVSIDRDNFEGRVYPPTDKDLGEVVTLVAASTEFLSSSDGIDSLQQLQRLGPLARLGVLSPNSGAVNVLFCLTDRGEILQLVAHEVRPVDWMDKVLEA
jgi:hypothetical protein